MKEKISLKVILIITLIAMWRLVQGQSPLDTIDWAYHQKEGCITLKERLEKVDTAALEKTLLESCKCALKLKNGLLALKYLGLVEKKGSNRPIIIEILKARSYALLNEDQKAMDILRDLSQKIDLIKVMEISEIKDLTMRNAGAMALYHSSRPAFDLFTFVIAVICFLGFFSGILFFIKSVHMTALRWLSMFIINFSIIMSSYVLYWTKFNWYFPYLNEWWHALYLLSGPFFYFYLKSITGDRVSRIRVFGHILPFIVCVGLFIFYGIFSQQYHPAKESNFLIYVFQSLPLKLISLSLYFGLSVYAVKGDWMIDSRVVKWIQYILSFFGVFILSNIFYYLCTFWEGFNRNWDYGISAVMSAGIIGVATMGFLESKYLAFDRSNSADMKQPVDDAKRTLIDEQSDFVIKKYKSSNLTTSASISVKTKLETLMSENKIYQREDLRLQDIADLVGLHRNQVSQVINENYNMSFFEWVNRYRIYHAADLLSTPKCPYTISQIGFNSGFYNKVTFYKTFRQYFQCTPLEYVARLENERAKMS